MGMQTVNSQPGWIQSDIDVRKSIIENQLIFSDSAYDAALQQQATSLKKL